MRIGIDISQIQYGDTGVGNYLSNLIENLIKIDDENEYILFFSSLRKKLKIQSASWRTKCKIKRIIFPASFLDVLWNKLHIVPIEWLIGDVDVFITSDWTEPPVIKAKKATILYDLIIYKYPNETDKKIIDTQKRKLEWVKKESSIIFCISEATKKDAIDILSVDENRLKVIMPGT
jgi:hypothetical protein